MTDEQRSLAGYKSKIHEQEDFENPNEGKPILDDSEEYILQLVSFPRVIVQTKTKEKKDGTKMSVKVDTAVCEFEEKETKNKVAAFFRVDSLNFSEDEAFESGIIRFFKKIKHPLVEGVEPVWDQYFVVGMRFRARVVVKKDKDKKPTGTYYLDVPTCRPLLPSDKTGEDFAKDPAPAEKPDATLANAKLIVKGAANFNDALQRLGDAKVSDEIIAAFVQANTKGQITYPI